MAQFKVKLKKTNQNGVMHSNSSANGVEALEIQLEEIKNEVLRNSILGEYNEYEITIKVQEEE